MVLSGKELVKSGIITNIINKNCIQQVGIDLELVEVNEVEGVGFIWKDKKTTLPKYFPIHPDIEIDGEKGWLLHPGYYEIAFRQGCKLPNNVMFRLRQRSSLLTTGVQIHSSVFDPGFFTKQMRTFMYVIRKVFISEGARVCQAYASFTTEVEEEHLYNGQFQADKQNK